MVPTLGCRLTGMLSSESNGWRLVSDVLVQLWNIILPVCMRWGTKRRGRQKRGEGERENEGKRENTMNTYK